MGAPDQTPVLRRCAASFEPLRRRSSVSLQKKHGDAEIGMALVLTPQDRKSLFDPTRIVVNYLSILAVFVGIIFLFVLNLATLVIGS